MSLGASAPAGYYGGPGGGQRPEQNQLYNFVDPGNLFGMKGKNAPPPVDFGQVAQVQGQANQQAWQQQTQANRPNQSTGFGSQSWTQGPDGSWTQNAQLNPALGGALTGLSGQAASNAQNGPQNIAQARQQAIDSNYNQATSRLDPQWGQRQEQLQAQLANQGISGGSNASNNALNTFGQQRNDAYSSAMNNAIGLGNATETTQLQALMSPYQQMGALHGFQTMPQFMYAGQAGPTPYMQGAEAGAGILQADNASAQQAQSGTMQGIGSLAAAIWSDERIKTNVKRLPVEAAPGIPFATFKYKHAPGKHHIGVIAQDVEKVRPDAVSHDESGIKRVDLAKLKPFGTR